MTTRRPFKNLTTAQLILLHKSTRSDARRDNYEDELVQRGASSDEAALEYMVAYYDSIGC